MKISLDGRKVWSWIALLALWGVILAWWFSQKIGYLPTVTVGVVLSLIVWLSCFFKGWIKRVSFFALLLFSVWFVLPFSIFMYSRSHVSSAVPGIFEVNPFLRSDDEIIGKWSGKEAQLTLAADKTFSYQTPDRIETGSWTRNGWNLYLKGKDYFAEMRFITLSKQYLLLTHPPDFSEDEGNQGLAEAIVSALQKVRGLDPLPGP